MTTLLDTSRPDGPSPDTSVRGGRRLALFAGLLVTLALAALIAYLQVSRAASPTATAERFAQALADGDNTAALAMLTSVPDGNRLLLDSGALSADDTQAIADVRVGEAVEPSLAAGELAAGADVTVPLTFALNGQDTTVQLALVKSGKRLGVVDTYQVLPTLFGTVSVPAGLPPVVGGVTLPAETDYLSLPAVYATAADPSGPLTAEPGSLTVEPGGSATVALDYTVPAELEPTLRITVDAALTECLKATDVDTMDCPFRYDPVANFYTVKVDRMSLELRSPAPYTFQANDNGSIDIVADGTGQVATTQTVRRLIPFVGYSRPAVKTSTFEFTMAGFIRFQDGKPSVRWPQG